MNPLAQFRGDAKAPKPLHPLERAFVLVTCGHFIFLPWALGTVRPWAQYISLGFALVGFLLSLWPRHYTEEYSDQGRFRLVPWPKLVRFPLFWLGLAFFALIGVQMLNPAWEFIDLAGRWTVRPLDYITWLPSSVRGTPVEMMTPWRVLLIYSLVWMVACSLWIGITRRAAVQILLGTIAINGAVLALVGLLQRVTNTREILWSIRPLVHYFVATFYYKNHAGAYFNLILAVCLALAVWYTIRARRRAQKSGPGMLYGFLAMIVTLIVVMSFSRMAALLAFAFLIVIGLAATITALRHPREGGHPLIGAATALLLVGFLGAGLYVVGAEKAVNRVETLVKSPREATMSILNRQLATKATFDMALDKPIAGHGAGSFRFIFPQYQRKYPEITYTGVKKKRWMYWEHAHNDYAEFFAEYGLVGVGLLLGVLGTLGGLALRRGVHTRPFCLILFGGLMLTLVHSCVDFQAHCPAILVTWGALAILVIRWAEFEARAR